MGSISPSAPAQIREFAQRAIEESKRPMTASEIERWIGSRNPALFRIITQKSPDYVHIILSLSPIEQLMKYRSSDPRTVSYGLPDAEYDERMWTPTRAKHRIRPITNASPQEKPAISLFPETVVLPMVARVNQETADTAWNALAALVNSRSNLWSDLLRAIEDMKESIENGIESVEAVNSVLCSSPSLTNPLIAIDVVTILSREALDKKEEMDERTEVENCVEESL
jgi:hypothetical protein